MTKPLPMKTRTLIRSVVSAVVLAAASAYGQNGETNTPPPAALERIPAETLNKISLSYRMGLNITVDFKRLGGFAISDPGPATGSAVDRTYDNGSYNKVDKFNNALGYTHYWGYENANQLQQVPGLGTVMVMEATTSPNNGVSPGHQNDPQHGLELSYSRQLYRDNKYRFGLEAAFGWTTLDIDDSQAVHTTVDHIVDEFVVPGGVNVVPAAPYSGTFQGPGPVLESFPTNRITTITPHDALVTGRRTVNSDIYTLRPGPYIQMPVYKKLSLTLSGGLTRPV